MENITLIGNLTRDVNVIAEGVIGFTVAIQRPFKSKEGNYDTDFLPVQVRGNAAKFAENLKKGDSVQIIGFVNQFYNKEKGINQDVVYSSNISYAAGGSANSVILNGRISKITPFNGGSFVTIAQDAGYKNAQGERVSRFTEVSVFGKTAELIPEVGNGLTIFGRAEASFSEDKGNVVSVIGDHISFGIKKGANAANAEAPAEAQAEAVELEDTDLPF